MEYNTKNNKSNEVKELKQRFHILASHPPTYNPFTGNGMQAWDEWASSCRAMERELEAEGVQL